MTEARFTDLLAAEWIKMRSLRSTYWVLVLGTLVAIGINVQGVHADLPYIDPTPDPGWAPGGETYSYDPLRHGLSDIAAYLMMLVSGCVGAIAVFGEYATGLIRSTFAAVPDRRAVVAAKVTVVTTVTLALGTAVSTISFFTINAIVASHHVGLSITDPGCLRAVTAYALAAPVCALVGMAFAAVFRQATASIVALVILLFILPLMFGGDRYRWLKEIGNHLPANAVSKLITNPRSTMTWGEYPPTITGSWLALAAWSLTSILMAIMIVRRRDV